MGKAVPLVLGVNVSSLTDDVRKALGFSLEHGGAWEISLTVACVPSLVNLEKVKRLEPQEIPSIKTPQSPNATWILLGDEIFSFVVSHSEDVLRPMLTGKSSVPWNAWIGPIITWTIFMAVVSSTLICTAEIFRKR